MLSPGSAAGRPRQVKVGCRQRKATACRGYSELVKSAVQLALSGVWHIKLQWLMLLLAREYPTHGLRSQTVRRAEGHQTYAGQRDKMGERRPAGRRPALI
jgi:hypothetical protein